MQQKSKEVAALDAFKLLIEQCYMFVGEYPYSLTFHHSFVFTILNVSFSTCIDDVELISTVVRNARVECGFSIRKTVIQL